MIVRIRVPLYFAFSCIGSVTFLMQLHSLENVKILCTICPQPPPLIVLKMCAHTSFGILEMEVVIYKDTDTVAQLLSLL